MAKPEKQQTIKHVNTNVAWIEILALSRVLEEWASPDGTNAHAEEWKKRLPAFRQAVMVGLTKHRRQKWPHEIVLGEYEVALQATDWLRQHPNSKHVRYNLSVSDGVAATILRPFHATGFLMHEDYELDRKLYRSECVPSTVASSIVQARLDISKRNVDDAMAPGTKKRYEATFDQQLLASILLDMCLPDAAPSVRLLTKAFETLRTSGYRLLGLYYLIHRAQNLQDRIGIKLPTKLQIERLCEFVSRSRPATPPEHSESNQ